MSIMHQVQWEVLERWNGTPVEVSDVLKALREGALDVQREQRGENVEPLTGRYETAFGAVNGVIHGCVEQRGREASCMH